MNHVVLIGNLTADPKLTEITVQTGLIKVVNFTLASNRSFKKRDGSWEQETTFVNCEAWDSGAERIVNSFKKGDRMFIQGHLKNEAWEKDGNSFRRDKIRVSHFERVVLSGTEEQHE
jgi:single-strand DNA-binding protein